MKSCRIFTILNVILGFFLITTPSIAQQNPVASAISTQLNKGFHRLPLVAQTTQGERLTLYKESHALLIGVSEYNQWQDLGSIPNELDEVDGALSEQGFSVERLVNPTGRDLETGINQFIDRHGFDPENRLLIYFSGHGHSYPNESKAYVVPVDAPLPDDRRDFRRKAVSMDRVMAWARDIESKHVLFVFDSCFAGDLFKSRSMPMENDRYIRKVTAKPVRQFLTAGSAGEEVPAKSTFTPAFVEAIRGEGDTNNDGYVTGTELGVHLSQYIPRFTEQTPQFGPIPDRELSRGDFVFFAGKTGVEPRIANIQSDEPSGIMNIEEVLWESAEGDDTESSYASYLERFPEGYFAGIARSRLLQIVKEREQREAEVKAEQDAKREQRRLAAVARVEAAKKLEQSRIEKDRQRRAIKLARQEALLQKERKRRQLEQAQKAQQSELERQARAERDRLLANQREKARAAVAAKKVELRTTGPTQNALERERFALVSDANLDRISSDRGQGRAKNLPDNSTYDQSKVTSESGAFSLAQLESRSSHSKRLELAMKIPRDWRRGVQAAFNQGGFNVGPEDGFWGARTRAGIRDWQIGNGYDGTGYLNNVQYRELVAELAVEPVTSSTVLPVRRKGKSIEPEMILIPGGSFRMGSTTGVELNEQPVRTVSIPAFEIGQYEVTFEQYDAFANATGVKLPDDNGWGRGNRPVINVSWDDAQAYVKWLNSESEGGYRLPSEAEWEYAARGDTSSLWSFGSKADDIDNYANTRAVDGYLNTSTVGSYEPNPFGVFDMHGNVLEWTFDCWHPNYNNAPLFSSSWNYNCGDDITRVLRGGSWNSVAGSTRSAYRTALAPNTWSNMVGFRVARMVRN